MDSKLHILQHSLGVGDYGDKPSYRNHFVTGPGSSDYDNCMELVADGLMKHRVGSAISGGDDIFHVTPKGIDHVALNSPSRPPKPKLTRSAQRYQNYRDNESSGSFREWLGIKDKSSYGY